MTSLEINEAYLEMEWDPSKADYEAAWNLYMELLTFISTQVVDDISGTEGEALNSIYSIFPTIRSVIRSHGRVSREFTMIALLVPKLVRPFLAKWHKVALNDGFAYRFTCDEFRKDLNELQVVLKKYTGMLGEIAGVKDDLLKLGIDD